MTRMAGANPKLASIFSGSNLGMNVGAMNNAAFQDRSALSQAATAADANAAIGDAEAEAMVKAAKYGAQATRAQGAAAGQSAMFGGLTSGISSLAGGFASMGGSQIGTNRGVSPYSQPHASGIGREALGGYDL